MHTADQLKELIKIFESEHPNLYIYVNACLLDTINRILEENLENNFKSVTIHEVTIDDTIKDNAVIVNLFERIKKKREELKKVMENGGS